MIDGFQKPRIEAPQFLIWKFVGTPAQKYRRPDHAPFKLSFVEEPGSRHGRCGKRSGFFLAAREGSGGAQFIVVLNEADKLRLVSGIGAQMKTNALRIAMFQAVIEPLVVAVIEAQSLQLPLQVPVRLGNEEEIGMALPHCGDGLRPILRLGTPPGPLAPRALEDRVQ